MADMTKVLDGFGTAEVRDWANGKFLTQENALSSKIKIIFGADFVGESYSIAGGESETYTGIVPASMIVEQNIKAVNGTYTITCDNSGGDTVIKTVRTGGYYGVYTVKFYTFVAYIECSARPGGSITATDGTHTVSGIADSDGKCILDITAPGTYTVSSEIDTGNTYSKSVIVSANEAVYPCKLVIRYGFKREKGNADAEHRISYLYDAEGMTPAGMTYNVSGLGTFSSGSWGDFIEEVARPVMLKNDGTVDYELDHSNQTLKLDGTASDISDTSYAGNAMVEFKKAFRYVKRYEDYDFEYVIFSNCQYDNTYHAYAHTNDSGNIVDAFYVGMFAGPYNNNVLRSICSGSPAANQTAEVEITRAKANGTGFNILYKSAWDYISDLLTLISKSDDSQVAFGSGVDERKNSITANNLKDVGAFYGTNTGKASVKVFWIVDYWGNMWQRLAGCVFQNSVKVKMYGPYCDTPVSSADYSSYTDTGIVPSGTSGNLTKRTTTKDEYGYLGRTAEGAAGTYVPDSLYFNNGQVDFALVGSGYSTALNRAGSRALTLDSLASTASATVGARLSYIPQLNSGGLGAAAPHEAGC